MRTAFSNSVSAQHLLRMSESHAMLLWAIIIGFIGFIGALAIGLLYDAAERSRLRGTHMSELIL